MFSLLHLRHGTPPRHIAGRPGGVRASSLTIISYQNPICHNGWYAAAGKCQKLPPASFCAAPASLDTPERIEPVVQKARKSVIKMYIIAVSKSRDTCATVLILE